MPPRAGRQRMRAWFVLAVAAAIVAGLLAGLVYALVATLSGEARAVPAVRPTPDPAASAAADATAPAADSGGRQQRRTRQDELAARPMLALPVSAARPQAIVPATAGRPIRLPAATQRDGLVQSGFPQTPEGALAQLAAIDAAAFEGLSPQRARQVYEWAALPQAVPYDAWTPTVAVTSALTGAALPDGALQVSSSFTPLAGQIKGSVGDDFVVACVLGEWQITYRSTTRAGAGDCQRMVWSGGRWRIGPGAQPAYAPSAWPGSADAVRAGWRVLTHA